MNFKTLKRICKFVEQNVSKLNFYIQEYDIKDICYVKALK